MPLLNSTIKKIFGTRKSTVKTYSVAPNSASVNEGSTVTFITTTRNVPSNTTLYYTLTGLSASDFTGSSSGSFTISNNTGSVAIPIVSDLTTEGSETLTFQLRSNSTSGTILTTGSVTINDTSTTPFTIDYLVVSGGGGGGKDIGGGGGAGGYISGTANLSFSSNYSITLGGGGFVS